MKKILLLLTLPFLNISLAQTHKVIESTSERIKIEFNFENHFRIEENIYNGEKFSVIKGKDIFLREPGEPWLPNYLLNIGLPFNSKPIIKILNTAKEEIQRTFILPTPDSLSQSFDMLNYNQSIYNSDSYYPALPVEIEDYVVRYAHLAKISVSPFQFNPVSRKLIFNKKLIIQIDFKTDPNNLIGVNRVDDKMTENLIKSTVINYNEAKNFIGKPITQSYAPAVQDTYWYNPQKDYYKIYLNKKGVYRITYDYLVNAGVPAGGLQNNQLELFSHGESIPIDVVDVNGDEIFNSGDYFQFVGGPAKPVDEYTRMNIYNKTNIYWFSYQADTLNYFKYKDGNPVGSSPLIISTVETLYFEQDLNYQHFGHANNNKRDYWQWLPVEARNFMPFRDFSFWIEDSIAQNRHQSKSDVKIRIGMHGLTTTSCATENGHSAAIKFNSKVVGIQQWNGQEATLFDKSFFIGPSTSGDTVQLLQRNLITVSLNGDLCSVDTIGNDYVWVNYIEFDYWRLTRTNKNYYTFISPPNDFGLNRYYLSNWQRDHMKIYIPSRGELFNNPRLNSDNSVVFDDTVFTETEYYCVANDFYLVPDSVAHHSLPSDLRSNLNGADYIIISHPLFLDAAEQLSNFRASNISGYISPRIKVINIFDIYNEFSFGLLNPFALQYFAKYVFENWQSPAPSFIVLLGDASYDYRKLFPSSRINFIPSIPYHGTKFGQLPSDNLIVAVSGNDEFPDISIGRLTCETPEEANVLVDKIINYPLDDSKPWKENTILLASGLSHSDQLQFQFNNYAKELESSHLIPNGIRTTKVFNYPANKEDSAFIGSGPRMREEINRGATVVSYYGHGGGAQWDLIFTKDDIPELTNGERLPFISSITCYTSHFDNAESFGEVFLKIPDKGAIGFWGSVSVTWWTSGHYMNKELFRNLFTNRNYVIGSSLLNTVASGISSNMVPQIVYLGDPAVELAIPKHPDFEIKSSDISISPLNPLKEDTVLVSFNITNLGITFPADSVNIELYENTTDTSNLIGQIKLPSFGQNTSLSFPWIPQEAGLYELIVQINEKDIIDEVDHSDNIASSSFSVFDFGQPNIIKPVNGYFTDNNNIDFILSDIGSYFNRNFNYLIQINNKQNFEGAISIQSPILNSLNSIVKWSSPSLISGEYFWKVVIYDAIDTNTSPIGIFTITDENGSGYLSKHEQLKMHETSNMEYSDSLKCLFLNTKTNPPHPEPKFFIDSVYTSFPDSSKHSIFTTDGTYFYLSQVPVYSSFPHSKIYKVGTGNNGSIAGEYYGTIPNLSLSFYSSIVFHSGFLYACTGPLNSLLKIDPNTGDTLRLSIPDSLLLTLEKPTQRGGCYLYSDGSYLYNLGIGTAKYQDRFVLRIFDPQNNFTKVGEDIVFNGTTMFNVMSFFVVDGYVIMYENYFHRSLRRYRIEDKVFEEEWVYGLPAKDYFTVTYDHINDFVYFLLFRPGNVSYTSGLVKYAGTYIEANGSITSQEIGPASEWYNLNFDIDKTNSNGTYKAYLLGKSKISGGWETLDTLTESFTSLEDIKVNNFNYLKLNFDLVDSSFGAGEPLKFNSLKVNYDYLPEISIIPKDMSFNPDSMMQGIDVNMNLKVHNLGYVPVDSLRMDFYLNEGDSIFFTKYISVQPDSFTTIDQVVETDTIIFNNKIKTIATSPVEEYFTYNNLTQDSFYVARDSVKPAFNITFDGKEILDGDIISSKPEVVITLKDNTPLQMDESLFTIVYDNNPLVFTPDTLVFEEVAPYPNAEVKITWTPFIQEDGEHTLEILAKDPSGNFFDSTSYRVSFFVFNESDLRDVYNYPNPFGDNTYFTFELRGVNVPEELKINIFTITGRMIREIKIPSARLRLGFNSIFWDGRDHDGDEIGNGLYFYKVIYKNEDKTKTITQKLAKVK